jgi:Tol biopolymer transport system component
VGVLALAVTLALFGCAADGPSSVPGVATSTTGDPSIAVEPSATVAATPSRMERPGEEPVVVGQPIDVATLEGRIVFDDFEDLYVMNADGTGLRQITTTPGAEFDGAWSPDGTQIVYRDSRRGINQDDEIYVIGADGSGARNLSMHPGNDWGPDWSSDGAWIAFNSDRGGRLGGWLVRPDGSDLRRIDADVWLEYPSFSPDGSRVVFMGHAAGDYDVYVADIATGEVTQLTDAPGSDGWPAWSPDGEWIAFKSDRDDCLYAADDVDCWRTGEPGEHHDIWIMRADGSDQRRVTPEQGQFVAWSPDGAYLLISGRTLYVVRPDGTGRAEIRPPELRLPPGGIPDWVDATPVGN